jgi:hypothetical protein
MKGIDYDKWKNPDFTGEILDAIDSEVLEREFDMKSKLFRNLF